MLGHDTRRLHELEAALITARWFAVAIAMVYVEAYPEPMPREVSVAAWAVIATLVAGNLLIWRTRRKPVHPSRVRRLAYSALLFDIIAALAFVFVFTFDQVAAVFTIIYTLPVLGAMKFRLRGAIAVMSIAAFVYFVREWLGAAVYGHEFHLSTIAVRMGVGFIIAIAAGSMAESYHEEHERVEELYETEREAADALRAMDEMKSTFFTAISHELRTPLTSVLGFALTIRDSAEELSESTRMMLDHVIQQAERLDGVVDDLLEVGHLTRGKEMLDLHQVDVGALVRRVVNDIARYEQRPLHVETQRAVAMVDPPKVERIIRNLVDNAIRYTEGAVWVCAYQREGGVLISVDDEGRGVPPELRKAVFEPFRRGELLTPHAPGTGIGLALVLHLSRLHGGSAWVTDRSNGRPGASFRVFLPAGQVKEEAAGVQASQQHPLPEGRGGSNGSEGAAGGIT